MATANNLIDQTAAKDAADARAECTVKTPAKAANKSKSGPKPEAPAKLTNGQTRVLRTAMAAHLRTMPMTGIDGLEDVPVELVQSTFDGYFKYLLPEQVET